MPSLTNFSNGVASFGIPLIGSGPILTTGKVFFVSNTGGVDATGRGSSPTAPFKTINFAFTKCTASKNDTIIVLPGHTEAISAAASIAANVAGVSVVGIGNDANRPVLTFGTATTATIAVSAANISFSNLVFDYTGFDAVATGINVTGAGCTISNCLFTMANVTNQATVAITLGTGAGRFQFFNNEVNAPNAGATACITSAVALDSVYIGNNSFRGDFSTAAINNATTAWTNAEIESNYSYILGTGKFLVAVSTTTGICANNHTYITANIAAGGSLTAAAMFKSQNFAQELAGVASSSVVDPAAAAIT